MMIDCLRQIFEKFSNTKFHQNPSNCSRVVLFVPTDVTKLIVAFRSSTKAPNNWQRLKKYLMINELPDNKYVDVLGPYVHVKFTLQPEVV